MNSSNKAGKCLNAYCEFTRKFQNIIGIIPQIYILFNVSEISQNVCIFFWIKTRSSATTEITRVGGQYAVQGHSRSLILVLTLITETPYFYATNNTLI